MTNRTPRILILTASYGDGHWQASRALKQAFHSQGIGEIRIMDLMQEAHPFLNGLSAWLYKKSPLLSRLGLDYYGWSYYLTRERKHLGPLYKYFNFLGRNKLLEEIRGERPDVIISTFPFGAAPQVCRDLGIRTYTVITDYALHARWLHPFTDKYYVATEELKEQIVKKGVARNRIEVSGIPIREAFYEDGLSLRNGFSETLGTKRKTVLLLAGSFQVDHEIIETVNALLALGGCQLAVVCGRNEKLRMKLRERCPAHPDLHIFGFVDNMHELMAVSTCIVTKAGGLTLSEALVLRIPLFIFRPFGGQERENALFFQRNKMAFLSGSTGELAAQIGGFLSDPSYAEEVKRRMEPLSNRQGADFIVKDILDTLLEGVSGTVAEHSVKHGASPDYSV